MILRRTPILVLGTDDLAERVLDGLRRDGRRALRFQRESLGDWEPRRMPTLILADPPEVETLVADLLARARERHHPGDPPLQRLILMHPQEPAPAHPALAPGDALALETFAIHDRAARALLRHWPLHLGMDPRFGQGPHVLILGFANPARALLLQILRLIHYGQGRPRISLLCDDWQDIAAAFLGDYPQAAQIADLRFAPLAALPEVLRDSSSQARPVTYALVCLTPCDPAPEPPGLALARGLIQALADIQGVSPPVLVEIGDAAPAGDLEDWDGQLIPFSDLRLACRAEVLLDGAGDEVARGIHEQYRDTIAAQGRDPDREPAGQPWERLATSYRRANRHQADHLWAKLAVSDCRAVPEELVESFVFSPLEVERLALIEHDRWAADRHLDGWRFGPARDNERKLHPQLIPYADLSEAMKDLDRFAVRGLPALAARLGLGILRLLILAVHPPGPDCPAGRRLRRLADDLLGRLCVRYPDRALVLAATLIDPREREAVRWILDREAGVGLFLLLPRPLGQGLAALPDPAARRDFLSLAARAERRISLPGEAALADWIARRAEISLVLAEQPPAGVLNKQVRLDAGGLALAWNFEY